MLLPLLFASLQSAPPAEAPAHARLHPADATYFMTLPDAAGLPAAYAKGALWSILTDPDLAEAVSELSGGEVDLGLVVERAQAMLEPENLPPEVVAMGLDAALRDLRALSASIVLPEDVAGTLEPFAARAMALSSLTAAKYRAAAEFYGDEQAPPATIEELEAILGDDARILTDPWGHRYTYRADASSPEGFVLTSLGADGAPGGAGADADVDSTVRIEEEALAFFSEHFAGRAVIEFGSPETAAQLFGTFSQMGLAQGAGARVELGEGAQGFAIQPPGAERPVAVVSQLGGHLLISLLADDPRGARQAAAAAAESGGLAADATYRSTRAGVPQRSGTALYESFARRSLATVFADMLEVAARADGIQIGGDFDAEEAALQVAEYLRGAASEYPLVAERGVLSDGLFVKDRFQPVNAATAQARLAEPKLDASMLASIPADAALVYATRMDIGAMGRSLRGMIDTLGGMSADAGFDAAGMLASLEEQAGGSVEARILANLGDQVLFTSEPIRGPAIPNTLLQIPVRDAEALNAGLAGWYGALSAAFPDELRYKDRAYKGFPLYSLTMSSAGFIAPGLATSIKDGVMITGLQNSHVRDLLREPRVNDDEELPVHPLMLGEMALAADVHSVLFVDWGGYFAGLYNTAKSFGAMASGFIGEDLPFDLTQLPDAEIVTRHLRPTVSTQRWTAAGLETHSQGSFGPEMLVAVAMAPAATLGMSGARSVPPPGQPFGYVEELGYSTEIEIDLSELQRGRLQSVRVGLEAYRYANGGSYPASLQLLGEPAEGYPQGFLAEGVELGDLWGNALHYRAAEGADSYELYSYGPNSTDDGGAGDDVRP